jgi:hypothetical protein
MKEVYTVGNFRGLTFAIHGRDYASVDVDFFKMGGSKPFFQRGFFSRNGAINWINKELAKLSRNYQ